MMAMIILGGATIYLLVSVVFKIAYPSITTNVMDKRHNELKFPAITICNHNMFR